MDDSPVISGYVMNNGNPKVFFIGAEIDQRPGIYLCDELPKIVTVVPCKGIAFVLNKENGDEIEKFTEGLHDYHWYIQTGHVKLML